MIRPAAFGESPPLALVSPAAPQKGVVPQPMEERSLPRSVNGRAGDDPTRRFKGPDPLVRAPGGAALSPEAPATRRAPAVSAFPPALLSFEGNGVGLPGFVMTVAPPDTEGDVGPRHYVQWVNQMLAVWDKAGTLLYGPVRGNTIFQGLKNPDGSANRCSTDNSGDPLVLYDAIADRWFLSQFAVGRTPYYQCVAVSKTGDPVAGGWFTWAYSFGTSFNDYAKAGVWPDAYYMTFNMFPPSGPGFLGGEACALDRVRMLSGASDASQQCFGPNPNFGAMLPTHLNLGGTGLPPAGAPNTVVSFGASGQLLLWPFHVDFQNPASSTFPFDTPTVLAVAPFRTACADGSPTYACVPQPATPTRLDSLGDEMMWRLNYRNFGTHESLVVNHSVDVGAGPSAGTTGVRWYEIRSPAATPVLFQQGTHAPDADHRWMASANLDASGDIAVGYSVSGLGTAPSIRWAGRLASDPPGTLAQAEATLLAGTGSQTFLDRWGDYSTMSVDPVDGCTFWYTQEYLSANGSFNWRTRVGAFRFPSCTNGCPAIAGTVTGGGTTCSGGAASVRVTVSGGTPPYRVELDNGGGVLEGAGPVFDFSVSPSSSTTYGVAFLRDAKGCTGTGAGGATVTVLPPPSLTRQPSPAVACPGGSVSFAAAASGAGLSYRWQGSAAPGSPFVDLADVPPFSGTASPTLVVAGVPPSLDGSSYRVVVSGSCPPAATSSAASLAVKSVTVLPTTLPAARAGVPYSVVLSGAGGVAPYSFSALSLPSWLTLAPSGPLAGTLAGTTTVAGSHSFGVAATDATACAGAARPYVLVVEPGPAAALTATSGTPQRARVGDRFALPLRATVTDAFGNPVAGVPVVFAAPVVAGGPSGTFPGGQATATATTDASGVATSPVLTATGAEGDWRATATSGALAPASFDLHNVDLAEIPAAGVLGLAALALLVAGTGLFLSGRMTG